MISLIIIIIICFINSDFFSDIIVNCTEVDCNCKHDHAFGGKFKCASMDPNETHGILDKECCICSQPNPDTPCPNESCNCSFHSDCLEKDTRHND